MKCVSCVAGYPPFMCLKGGKCGNANESDDKGQTGEGASFFVEEESPGRQFVDPVSTGRKRAAVLYKIAPGQVCDWANRKNCGGGISPIIGCSGRPAAHIHHGPDKSTLNNDRETNISLVCHFCHNRWHVANDKYYTEPRPTDNGAWLPTKIPEGMVIHQLSEMVKATKEEIIVNELGIAVGGKDKA